VNRLDLGMMEEEKQIVSSDASVDAVQEEIRKLILLGSTSKDELLKLEKEHTLLDSYIFELSSLGVERLSREPGNHLAAADRLHQQLQDVACSHYRALTESFNASGFVRAGVGDLRENLNTLLELLPSLSENSKTLSVNASRQNAQSKSKLNVLEAFPRLTELLELPVLMLALVKAEQYEEALELDAYVQKIRILFPNESIIASVSSEVDRVTQRMVQQILAHLKAALQLPICFQMIGFLRRLQVMSEPRLRRVFLHCRSEYMRSQLDSSLRGAPNLQVYLVRLCDETRAMIFEVVTQYCAVFGDSSGALHETSQAPSDAPSVSYSIVLCDFIQRWVNEYMLTLETNLSELSDGASLRAVIEQGMYCAHALGRVGVDFRPRLVPLFSLSVVRLFRRGLMTTLRRFKGALKDYNWTSLPLPGTETRISKGDNSDNIELNPPREVLRFTPLAILLNGILAAMNEIRICCPKASVDSVRDELRTCLVESAELIVDALKHSHHDKTEQRSNSVENRDTDSASRQQTPITIFRNSVVQHSIRVMEHCTSTWDPLELEHLYNSLDSILATA